jgi:uncharacterized protein involved in exopolysaccharide biosynthesis
MPTKIEQEAIQLRQEHADLSVSLGRAQERFKERMEKPRLINDLASRVAQVSGVELDLALKLGVGPRVYKRTEAAIEAYDSNINKATEHFEQNYPQYLEAANEEDKSRFRAATVEPTLK